MRWRRSTQSTGTSEYPGDLEVPWVAESPAVSVPQDVVESLRYMLTRVTRSQALPSCVAFVATQRDEGVTFLAHTFGAILAHDLAASVAVVSLNWWWPAPNGISSQPLDTNGLAGVLFEDEDLSAVAVKTGWDNLDVIPSGELRPQVRAVAARSELLRLIIEDLGLRYDHLVLDIPAILATSDAIPLASLADACALVIRHGRTPLNQVRLALKELPHLPVLGVIINQMEVTTPQLVMKFIPTN